MSATEGKRKGEACPTPQSEGAGTIAKLVRQAAKALQANKAAKSLLDEADDQFRFEEGSTKLRWKELHQLLNGHKKDYLDGKNNAQTFYQLYIRLNATINTTGSDLFQSPRTRHELIGCYLELAFNSKKSAGNQKKNEKLEIYLYALHTIKAERENSGAGSGFDHVPAAEIAKRAYAMGLTETKHQARDVRSTLAERGFTKKLVK